MNSAQTNSKPQISRELRRKGLFIVTVFLVAVSGLAYELVAGTAASYLLGQSITHFSFSVGTFLASMGIGSFLSRNIKTNVISTFIWIQVILALVGGFSALLMYLSYAFLLTLYPVFFTLAIILGAAVGMEIPLLIRLASRFDVLSVAVSDILTWDYAGALFASILFPLLFLPDMGLIRSSLFFGGLNLISGYLLYTTRKRAKKKTLLAALVASTLALGGAFFGSEHITGWIESGLYQDPIIHAKDTKYQRIVVTRWKDDVRLFLDGNVQFSSRDEARYHEAITHIPILFRGNAPSRALILGGGDGLVARELLKYPTIRKITLVDLDQEVVRISKELSDLKRLNQGSLEHPTVEVVIADAFSWVKNQNEADHAVDLYDVVIVDLPDPDNYSVGKLYTVSFYRELLQILSPGGVVVTQASSSVFAATVFESIQRTMKEAISRSVLPGYQTEKYHLYIPSFGDWGFVMAHPPGKDPCKHGLPELPVETSFLNPETVCSLFVFGKDHTPVFEPRINRLTDQGIVDLYHREWNRWYE